MVVLCMSAIQTLVVTINVLISQQVLQHRCTAFNGGMQQEYMSIS